MLEKEKIARSRGLEDSIYIHKDQPNLESVRKSNRFQISEYYGHGFEENLFVQHVKLFLNLLLLIIN